MYVSHDCRDCIIKPMSFPVSLLIILSFNSLSLSPEYAHFFNLIQFVYNLQLIWADYYIIGKIVTNILASCPT